MRLCIAVLAMIVSLTVGPFAHAATIQERAAALSAGTDSKNAPAWMELALDAKRANMRREAEAYFTRVIEIEPNNEVARESLGYIKANNTWMKADEIGKPSRAAAAPSVPHPTASDLREKMAKQAGVTGFSESGEQPVNCPKCNGSGTRIWLDCLNCIKSDKPGYKFTGQEFVLCNRCAGSAKLAGAACNFCRATGKVVMSHVAPAEGGTKKAPNGFKWCPTCNGSQYEMWSDCSQCKRSKWPGWVFKGEALEVCNRCFGASKLPTLKCGKCKGTGVVSEKTGERQ